MRPDSFNEQLAVAAREMASQGDLHETLDRAVAMVTDIIDHCHLAGISVVHHDGTIDTPSATGEDLRRIDQAQYRDKEGPCFDALREDDTVVSLDLAADPRWPHWGPWIAREVGVRSSLSLRLFTTGGNLGALNLYSRQVNAFTHDDLDDAAALAAHAAVALAAALREEHLHRALASRTLIAQASGMLIERFGLEPDAAVALLRRVSSVNNLKMREVAQHLVDTRRLPR